MPRRQVSEAMKPLYEKLEDICDMIDGLICMITGQRYAFSLVVFSKDKDAASIVVTNSTELDATKSAIKEWLDAQETQQEKNP